MIWVEVAIRVPRSHLEAVTAVLLDAVPTGFAEVRRGRGARRTLLAYLPVGREGRRLFARLRAAMARTCPTCSVDGRRVSDAVWKDAWRVHARPVRVGRIEVVPSWWRQAHASKRLIVRVDPGQAFGSGEHASTQLCLEAVSRYVRKGTRMIDVGTGSGILAISAATLGAARVVAVDNDPVALQVARANALANDVATRIRVVRHEGLRGVRGRADLIVANLTADTLPPVVECVRARLAADGQFVAAGFTTARLREVAQLVRSVGLRITDMPSRRGWRAIHTVQPGRAQ